MTQLEHADISADSSVHRYTVCINLGFCRSAVI